MKQIEHAAADRALQQLYQPTLTRGEPVRRPLPAMSRVNNVRLRFRTAAAAGGTITGDCIANLLGYQTTSAVVNRLAGTIRVTHIEMWAAVGAPGDSTAGNTVGANIQITFREGPNSDNPVFPKSYVDEGSRSQGAHISVRPPANYIIDCAVTNRWVFFDWRGPLGMDIDVSLEWSDYRIDAGTPYTLTAVTTTVGSYPYCAYLDNTTTGGSAGAQVVYRLGPPNVDFNAYG